MEKEVTGMYLSGHPMAPYAEVYRRDLVARTDEIAQSAAGESDKYSDEQYVDVLAIVSDIKRKVTKSGANMAFLTLEDIYGSMEALVFPEGARAQRRPARAGQRGQGARAHQLHRGEGPEARVRVFHGAVFARGDAGAGRARRGRGARRRRAGGGPGVQIRGYNTAYRGLYLRVPSMDDPLCKKGAAIYRGFRRCDNLYLYALDRQKLVRAPAKYRVAVNYELVAALKLAARRGQCGTEGKVSANSARKRGFSS